MLCCNACRHELQLQAAESAAPQGTQAAPRALHIDVTAGSRGNSTLDMPCNSPPVADSNVCDSTTDGRAVAGKGATATAEGRAAAGKGTTTAAGGRAVAGKGISAAAAVKASKAAGDNTHTTGSVPAAALDFAAVSSAPAGKRAPDPQDPLSPLHLGSDTPTQGRLPLLPGASPTPLYNPPAKPSSLHMPSVVAGACL